MENNFALIVHPSYDHVGAWHLSTGRETESHPTLRADAHSELDSFRGEVVAPVELVIVVQSSREWIFWLEVKSAGVGRRAQQQYYCRQQRKQRILHFIWLISEV